MSSYYNSRVNCISCEWTIGRYPDGDGKCRAIYLTPGGAKLSGYIYTSRDALNTPYSAHDDIDLELMANGLWMKLASKQPAEAYLIHSECWSLLIIHFANDAVDLDRLFEVCGSRPGTTLPNYDNSLFHLMELKPPHLDPRIRLGSATKKLWTIQHSKRSVRYDHILGADCFSLLPTEIRLEIAAYLSTADFLSLRLVSRGIAVIFALQSFWKTRFRVNGDRGFLVGLTERLGGNTNWRSIYHRTARVTGPHNWLKYMRQIWRKNCWLRDRYSMTQAWKNPDLFNSKFGLPTGSWRKAAAETYSDYSSNRSLLLCSCCRPAPLLQKIMRLESPLIGFTMFILDEETTKGAMRSHIIGFDLIYADEEVVTLGHRLPGSQVTINFDGRHLRGFNVITSARGIRGLQPIFDSGPITSWIGDSQPDVRSHQLLLKDDLKAISARFDYCKMVSLSIA